MYCTSLITSAVGPGNPLGVNLLQLTSVSQDYYAETSLDILVSQRTAKEKVLKELMHINSLKFYLYSMNSKQQLPQAHDIVK